MKNVYIQGDLVAEDAARLSIADRGLRFGDGVFETIRVENARMYNFPFHLQRLSNGLAAIKISANVDDVYDLAKALITKNELKRGFVRVSVSRGSGSKGYMPAENSNSVVIIETVDGIAEQKLPAKLWVSSYKAQVLAPAKTMNGLRYTLALLEAKEHDADNALLLDDDGNICETASGNIFWFKNGELFTPALDLQLIPGSIRARIFALYKGKITEGHFKAAELDNADEIFMTNVNCLVLPFTAKMEKTLEIKKLVEDDIKTNLG